MHARIKALPFQTCSTETRPDRSIHMKVEGTRSEGQTGSVAALPTSLCRTTQEIGAIWKEFQTLPSPKLPNQGLPIICEVGEESQDNRSESKAAHQCVSPAQMPP
jgi:hypothetical protein